MVDNDLMALVQGPGLEDEQNKITKTDASKMTLLTAKRRPNALSL